MDLRTDEFLTIELHGVERLAAIRRRVVVPRSEIIATQFHAEYADPGPVWRMVGIACPKVVYAGLFGRAGRSEFWYVRRPSGVWKVRAENVLELRTTGKYARIVLSASSAEADRLTDWWRSSSG